MFTKIDLTNSSIFYMNEKVLIRHYVFNYINRISKTNSEYDIYIYFNGSNDNFIVEDFFGMSVSFDSFNDANTFAYKNIENKMTKLEEEVRQMENMKKRKGSGK